MWSSINSAKICGHLVFGKTWKDSSSVPRKTFPVEKLLMEFELGHFSHLKILTIICFRRLLYDSYKQNYSSAELGVLVGNGKHLAGLITKRVSAFKVNKCKNWQ